MSIYSLSGLLTVITSGLMTLLMFSVGKKKLHYLWATFCFCVFLFGLGVYFVGGAITAEKASFGWKLAHVGAILIPVLFLHFVYEFLEIKKTKSLVFLYLVSLLFLIADLSGDFFISDMRFVFNQFYYDSPPQSLYVLFTAMFFGLTAYSHYILWKGFRESKDEIVKEKIKLFFFGTGIGFAGGTFNFLPVYGIDIYPYMNLTVFLYPLIISYAILRHHLFDLKLIVAELLTFAIWGAVLVQTIMADTFRGKLLGVGTLTFAVVLGIFLIKSVKKEVAQREQIEELAGRLKSVNRIMSHDIKNVLGKDKDMFGMLLDGSFGALSDQARSFLQQAHDDTKKLISSVIAILEAGQEFILKPVPFDLKEAVQEVIKSVAPDAEKKGLTLTVNIPEQESFVVAGDRIQLTARVIKNLVENAVNYTLAGGVTVGLSKKGNSVIFSVKDTGIGISDEDKPTIFKEGGHGKDSLKFNVHSTGYGLFSVKKVVDAHGGKVWFETEHGKGTTFFVEMRAG